MNIVIFGKVRIRPIEPSQLAAAEQWSSEHCAFWVRGLRLGKVLAECSAHPCADRANRY
jgi:hypothetical protein